MNYLSLKVNSVASCSQGPKHLANSVKKVNYKNHVIFGGYPIDSLIESFFFLTFQPVTANMFK